MMTIRATAEQQLGFLQRDVTPLVRAVVEGMDYNPGHSDLDDEQPINVSMTLGEYRRARRLLYKLERPIEHASDWLEHHLHVHPSADCHLCKGREE